MVAGDREGLGEGAVADLVGGHAEDFPLRYEAVDPMTLAPSGVRTVVVHGDLDVQVPVGHSRSYVHHARAAGEEITMLELPGIGHFELIDPLSSAWPHVLQAILIARNREA